jgi:hypothetical protein
MKYYKSLTLDRKSWHDGTTTWEPGQPMPILKGDAGPACGTGYHFAKSIEQAVGYGRFLLSLWEAEPQGDKLGEDDAKVRYTGGMIIKEVKKPVWIERTETFIESIKSVKWMDNHGKINPSWKMHDTRDSAGDSARASARDSARDSAGDSAWDSAWASAGAAARDAARAAARDAARDAAGAAAGAAAWAAAWDASLMAQMEICCDLHIPAKHRKHARDRWAVWQAGYGCLCDVSGVLYVYKHV